MLLGGYAVLKLTVSDHIFAVDVLDCSNDKKMCGNSSVEATELFSTHCENIRAYSNLFPFISN